MNPNSNNVLKKTNLYQFQKNISRIICKPFKLLKHNRIKAIKTKTEGIIQIYNSGLFRQDFYCFQERNKIGLISKYITSWQHERDLKKPMPGFHPKIYKSSLNITNLDPFAHYIKMGFPNGEWSYPVITPSHEAKKITNTAALQLHLFYPEMAEDIIQRLIIQKNKPDLLISVTSIEAKDYISRILKKDYPGNFLIKVVPNRGRDIGPLLTEFNNEIRKYEFIGHFHTKVSPHLSSRDDGARWYNFLLENVIGGKSPMLDITLSTMSSNSNIGLVFPDDPHVFGWDANFYHAQQIAKRIGIKKLDDYFNFPAGTMFWARYEAIKPLFELSLKWDDYPSEPIGHDGTMLHAIERLIPFVTLHSGYKIAVTNVPAVTY